MLNGRMLHVGCGGDTLPDWAANCDEVRLDIDRRWNPDIVGNITDLSDVCEYDFIYGAHVLEHVFPHEVKIALKGFLRALKPGGTVLMFVPDLEDIKPSHDVLYDCMGGTVSGLDMFYGHGQLVEVNPFMAHRTGFTRDLLETEFKEAGFVGITGTRLSNYSLMVCGKKEREL